MTVGFHQSFDFSLITVYVLINWVFEYPSQSKAYGFPFDRQHLNFYRRLQKVHHLLRQIMDLHLSSTAKEHKPVFKFCEKFIEIVEDERLNALAASLERKAEVFDKLREAMRIAQPDGKQGLNDDGDEVDMKTIEKSMVAFRKWLVRKKRHKTMYAGMVKQLDKYWVKLFADPYTSSNDGWDFLCLPAKNKQPSGTIFPRRKTTQSQKERYGLFK